MSAIDTSTAFRDMAERLFGDFATPAVIEAAEDGNFPQMLWNAVLESGIGHVLVDEAHGGIGATLADAAAVLHAAGKHAAPGPLLELMLANQWLARAGLATSEQAVALALTDHLGDDLPAQLPDIAWAGSATHVVLLAPSTGAAADGARLARVPMASFERRAAVDASGEPRDTLVARADAQVDWLPLPGTSATICLQQAAVLRAAQMIGAMHWCLDRTTAYALERKQFGREIGRFQVVQQMIAELASTTVAASAMVDAAVADSNSAMLVAAARSRLGDAVDSTSAISHQVHGAIGFSYAYALHFRTRRLLAWRDEFGTVAHWRRVLAGHFLGQPADAAWPTLVATSTHADA